jgi:prefoldin subunit 5
MLQAEALQQKTEEARQMREKVMALEITISSGAEEKGQCEVMVLLIMSLCFKVHSIYLS